MKKAFYLLTILFLSAILFGCASTPKEIPDDLSAAQLIQLGQNEYGSGNYKGSELYYLTAIRRFGMDTAIYIEVKYELGHLYVAKKDYKKAYETFTEILEIYDYATVGDLPASYKKLANIGLSKIPENKLKEFQKETAEKKAAENLSE